MTRLTIEPTKSIPSIDALRALAPAARTSWNLNHDDRPRLHHRCFFPDTCHSCIRRRDRSNTEVTHDNVMPAVPLTFGAA